MQWSTITTILTLLLLNSSRASAFSIARVWASFYSECPATDPDSTTDPTPDDIDTDTDTDTDAATTYSHSFLSNFFASFFQRTEDQSATVVVDIYSGTCQSLPVGRRYNADAISFNAESLYSGPYDHCNVTLHEVPGCVDKPLVEVPFQDGSAEAECTEREFTPLSQMWILLHCETDRSPIRTGSTGKGSSSSSSGGQQKPSQQSQSSSSSSSSSSDPSTPNIPNIPEIPAIPDIPKLQPTLFSKLHAALENATATNATAPGAVSANSTGPVLSRAMRLRRAARTRLSNL
ncbi:uncharacterized protein BO97DRAFT_83553 [Aspergillus homomorphus CBS 101889]|uniref:Pal1-domain-containing protein n=1 Tax=Aspergillus homomorphus (strain CBS 101889) TaxID=1450537 RepID=A0A395ID83_ASPHC|nr:hypothetical protein BO97DRAFT_83553 [Aspergillus homomorphus CBS 101889]RAL17098.1 hypothetical protein BO97DRAFT_83553 [Aspergillus homomorphus CBS 101889]